MKSYLLCLLAAITLVSAADKFTPKELTALFPADLGPDEIDVAGYPEEQRKNYRIFTRSCQQCHGLARAVNSPHSSRKAWAYYLFRMRVHAATSPSAELSAEDRKAVLDFLAYDSKVRKVDKRKDFEELTRTLEKRFDETVIERMRRLQEQPLDY